MKNMMKDMPQANQSASPTLTELALEARKNTGTTCNIYSQHLRNTKFNNGISNRVPLIEHDAHT